MKKNRGEPKKPSARGPVAGIGAWLLERVAYSGSALIILGRAVRGALSGRARLDGFLLECEVFGSRSFWTVTLVSFFMGMVLAMQAATPLRLTGSETYVAILVAVSAIREMGPLITAFLVCGRVGSAIAAELGTMKITDQLDALRTLAVDPVDYLVLPKLLAAILMVPALTIVSTAVQMFGGWLIGVGTLNIGSGLYIANSLRFVVFRDVLIGLLKALVFAVIIVVVSSREGFHVRGGARGVGNAATTAVVVSLFLIIFADFLITAIFYFL